MQGIASKILLSVGNELLFFKNQSSSLARRIVAGSYLGY